MKFKVGDNVRYYPVTRDRRIFTEHTVVDVLPEGIPSFQLPMLKLSDKPGYVNADHCETTTLRASVEGEK